MGSREKEKTRGAFLPLLGERQVAAVIWDMDGVLVDSEPHHVKLEKKLFEELGLDIAEEEHLSYMGKPADKMWEEIKELKGVAASLEVLNERHRMVAEKYFSEIKDIKPVDGLVDVLEELKGRGLPMAVASSSLRSVIDIILKKTGLEKYFDVIVSREDVKEGKPSPDIFLHAASLLNAGPEECIVIEDSSNGIKAAKAAGMFCVAFTGTGDGNADTSSADVEIRSLRDLTH